MIIASWGGDRSPPGDTEQRMAEFAQMLDTAIANADSRDQLMASRTRLLSAGDEGLRARAVGYLKRLHAQLPEACLLYVVDDPLELPLEYLLTIADPERTEEDTAALRPMIGRLICRFLESDRGLRASTERRVYAIQQLALFGRAGAEKVLDALLVKRRAPFLPRESRAVRTAAKKAIAELRARRGGPNV